MLFLFTDLEKFLDEEVHPTLCAELQSLRLDGAPRVFKEYQHKIDTDERRIEELALAILPHNWSAGNDMLRKDRGMYYPGIIKPVLSCLLM